MSKILTSFKKSVIEDIKNSIIANTAYYYAFASNPIENSNTIPVETLDDYSAKFYNDWQMLFGKRIKSTDIYPVISKNMWVANTKYERYDNTSNTVLSNNMFYVISEPIEIGGEYHIYKCIDNANNGYSTINPSTIAIPTQLTTFTTSDNYKWRYITSVSSVLYDRFATDDYVPVYENDTVKANAKLYSGVEVVVVSNTGSGYSSYANGTLQGVVNSTLIQIANNSSSENFYYNNNSIYIYNVTLGTSTIKTVNSYISNSTGKWIYLDSAANTSVLLPSQSLYIISPRVVFDTDGDSDPIAYSVVNAFSNSISSIVVLDIGSNISRANVHIESSFGSGANLYAIVPSPGGHGYNTLDELNVKGLAIAFSFANTEINTIPTSNVVYNKIGIIKNPGILNSNNTKGATYTSNTFNQLLEANVSPSYTFTVGQEVIGANSGARGIVAFSNSSQIWISGDKEFIENEYIGNTSVKNLTQININTIGDIYAKDLSPLYIQNINNVNRSNTQTESFKIIIQV